MSEPNGSYITRAELAAHIKGIDQAFQDIRADVVEIRYGIKGIVDAMASEKSVAAAFRRGFWRAWAPPLIAAFVAASVSLAAALILH